MPTNEDTIIGHVETSAGSIILRRIVSGLQNPWAFEFLPSGEILITQREGTLVLIDGEQISTVTGLPPISAGGQGGLLDILVDPDFEKNRTVYFTYATAGSGGRGTTAARAQLDGYRLSDVRVLWEMKRKTGTGHHFGSRIRMLTDSTLLISTGDRGDMKRAQDMADAAGKTHRINATEPFPWIIHSEQFGAPFPRSTQRGTETFRGLLFILLPVRFGRVNTAHRAAMKSISLKAVKTTAGRL